MSTQVEITRLPITSPCPVPVVAGTGETMRDGEPIDVDDRTELCAVDAAWMIGSQRCCDIHLRIACDLGGIDFDGVVVQAYASHGPDAVDQALERAARPWSERHRYTQDDTRSWAESAQRHGLA